MDLSGIEYLGFHRVMERGTAEIIEKSDDVLFIGKLNENTPTSNSRK